MTDVLDRRNSVTRDDYLPTADQGVWSWTIYDPSATQSPVPQLPYHGTRERDRILTATLDLEDMWASAVNKAVTKIAVRGYEVSDNDDSTRRTEAGQALARDFDGPAEYRTGMAKVVQDFLLADNGWFVEVARASQKVGAKVQALYHLDSFRCYRTGNLDYPVLYLDWEGGWHKLRADQVIFGSDMPSPRARMFNRGRCAASRAFQTIVKLSAVETYFREKITGSRALALHFVTGISKQQLLDAMETSEAEKTRKGHVVYKGAVMIPIQTDQPINIASIDLASVPDGFDVDLERKDAYLRYANALGIPVQDIQPLSGQGLGTGTQTIVLDEAAEGQGLAYFVKDFEDKLNHLVFPKQTIFQIKVNDVRDQTATAALNKSKADTLVALLTGGVISQAMALQMAVDDGIVPPEFLPQDVTPAGILTDSGDQSKAPSPTPRAPYAGVVPPPVAPAPATKEAGPDIFDAINAILTEQEKADDPDDDDFDRLIASPRSQAWLKRVAAEMLQKPETEPAPSTNTVTHYDRAARLLAEKAIRIAKQGSTKGQEEVAAVKRDIENQVIGAFRSFDARVKDLEKQRASEIAIPDDDWQEAVKWAEEAST